MDIESEDHLTDRHLTIWAFNMAPYKIPLVEDPKAVPLSGRNFSEIFGLNDGLFTTVYEQSIQQGYYKQLIEDAISHNS
jgi:hypothetical protein